MEYKSLLKEADFMHVLVLPGSLTKMNELSIGQHFTHFKFSFRLFLSVAKFPNSVPLFQLTTNRYYFCSKLSCFFLARLYKVQVELLYYCSHFGVRVSVSVTVPVTPLLSFA